MNFARVTHLSAPLLAGILIAGCGSSTAKLNTAHIERAVAASILAERGLHTRVICPSPVPRKQGYKFTCTAHLDAGTYPVTVTETNDRGYVRYANRRPLVALDIAKVEQAITVSIARERRLAATVSCPPEVLREDGVRFTCTALIKGDPTHYTFSVTEIDGAGHVRYVGH